MMDHMATLGDNVRAERARKNWSQQRLAELAGVAATTVARIESGCDANLTTLNAIALALGVDLSVIVPTQAAAEGGAA